MSSRSTIAATRCGASASSSWRSPSSRRRSNRSVDGILVVDLSGQIRNFNHRFADLWELPDELLTQRADDAVLDWMRATVVDPARYMRRLAAIDDATMLRASDVVALRSGRVVERVTMPQCSRGQPIGRVFTFREISPGVRALRPAA